MTPQPSVNYYDLFQINPRAELETIERVYRLLAARYHPDNQNTGDPERFRILSEAYQVLRDPAKRKEYDRQFEIHAAHSSFIISAEGVDYLESQLPTNQILYKIFRASENGVMVYPKALTSKTP